jgi:hypothetical protein
MVMGNSYQHGRGVASRNVVAGTFARCGLWFSGVREGCLRSGRVRNEPTLVVPADHPRPRATAGRRAGAGEGWVVARGAGKGKLVKGGEDTSACPGGLAVGGWRLGLLLARRLVGGPCRQAGRLLGLGAAQDTRLPAGAQPHLQPAGALLHLQPAGALLSMRRTRNGERGMGNGERGTGSRVEGTRLPAGLSLTSSLPGSASPPACRGSASPPACRGSASPPACRGSASPPACQGRRLDGADRQPLAPRLPGQPLHAAELSKRAHSCQVAPLIGQKKTRHLPTATRPKPDRLDNPNRPVSILSNSEPALCALAPVPDHQAPPVPGR